MPVYVQQNRRPVLFIHIPKCGGSSFSAGMIREGWQELYSIRGLHANALQFTHCSPQHWHRDILESMFRITCFEYVILIMRDPFERLMSEYRWQLHQKITDLRPGEWTKKAFSAYMSNPYIYDNHLRHQSDFYIEGSKAFLLENHGVEKALKLARAGASLGQLAKPPQDGYKSEISPLRLKMTKYSQHITEAFSPVFELVQEFYQKDYDLLAKIAV